MYKIYKGDYFMKEIYADHNATTYIREEVLEAMMPYFKVEFGNASSSYSIGRRAKQAVDEARSKVAKAINAKSEEIYFTASGSEADNLVLRGIVYANRDKGNHIITSKIEHPAVLNTCKDLEKQGFNVTYLSVDEKGFVSLDELRSSITEKTILISIMTANNEIGTIQNIQEIGKIARFKDVYFHTDSVQAIGNIKIDVKEFNIDALSMSAHKFYGPKGVGVAYMKKEIKFDSIITGGHQEKNKRAGTENVAAIVGMGKAIELANEELEEYNKKLMELRDYTINRIINEIKSVKINGDLEQRLAGNINISIEGIESSALLLMLDMKGICVSSGSACSSGGLSPSHVLKAIGLEDNLAKGSLRISYGKNNTLEDAKLIVDTLKESIKELRKMNKN